MATEAREFIPGGVQHNLAFNHPFPLVIDRSEGTFLHDIDGNSYIDFLQGGGPTVLGGNCPEVREQVIELLRHSLICIKNSVYQAALLPTVDHTSDFCGIVVLRFGCVLIGFEFRQAGAF